MMDIVESGYQEIEHTADWALRVWAPDIEALFVQAADGMNHLSEITLDEKRVEREFEVQADDPEGLLVAFLSELLYFGEDENIGFDNYLVEIRGDKLYARAAGGQITGRKKEIKAVTFHNLAVRKTKRGFEVEIVFDV